MPDFMVDIGNVGILKIFLAIYFAAKHAYVLMEQITVFLLKLSFSPIDKNISFDQNIVMAISWRGEKENH